ncbi:MAG: protein-disulfide reductase DsbD family protein [Pseudomonadales bacterium]|nr:protein-disulfide reductase DsbD family protein [Pseudomonadales bacterium]
MPDLQNSFSFFLHRIMLSLLILGAVTVVSAHAEVHQGQEIEVEFVAETTAAVPGQTLWLALRLEPTEGWHTYSKWPGDSGDATFIREWNLPEGVTAGDIQWPIPEWLPFPGSDLVTYAYENEVFLPIPIQVPASFQAETLPISAHVEWQVCDLICIIEDAEIRVVLPVSNQAQADQRWTEAFAQTRANLPSSDHDIKALFAVAGERVSFSFESAEGVFGEISDAWFFPENRRVLKPGPLRLLSLNDQHIQITHAQHRRIEAGLQEVPGLLKIADTQGNVQGFLLTAEAANADNLASLTALAANAGSSGNAGNPANANLLLIIVFALAGGLILNLMPCVFPVLSLKVMSFARHGETSGREQKLHGLAYTAGITLTFMVLASILLSLRAGGEAVGWAFQLQSPWFIAVLIYLFFTMGLSLSGVYEFGTGMMGIGNRLTERQGYQGSFFTGVLATVVASPCTAPFMGAALGFALSQSWLVAMLVFFFLGLGMALPFLVLSFSPRLLKFMPKPGQWMETFKELMAFPLYATVLWLLWVLGMQVGINGMVVVIASCLLLAFGLWLLQQRNTAQGFWRTITAAVCALSVGGALYALTLPQLETRQLSVAEAGSGGAAVAAFEPYSRQRLDELRANGQPVFINMTAAWCITCLANEQTTLSSAQVKEVMDEMGITYLKGDWTNQDPEISQILDEFNRPSVPLYLYYPADPAAAPVILPQILTPSTVVEIFRQNS